MLGYFEVIYGEGHMQSQVIRNFAEIQHCPPDSELYWIRTDWRGEMVGNEHVPMVDGLPELTFELWLRSKPSLRSRLLVMQVGLWAVVIVVPTWLVSAIQSGQVDRTLVVGLLLGVTTLSSVMLVEARRLYRRELADLRGEVHDR